MLTLRGRGGDTSFHIAERGARDAVGKILVKAAIDPCFVVVASLSC